MGGLLRLLLGAVARGLRAIAGRLTPAGTALVAVQPPAAVEDGADGVPGHWLEMVRARAPGLHLSLQERGIARRVRPPAAGPTPALPAESALEPRGRNPGTPPRPAASPPPLPVARPARPLAAPPQAATATDPQPDPQPHAWESTVFDDDQEDWTRAPLRRSVPPSSPLVVPAVRRSSAADAAVAAIRRPANEAPGSGEARVDSARDEPRTATRRVATRPELRPLPVVVPIEPVRHSTATPLFAPSRDEDQALHRPVRARTSYPTPVPTPWSSAALPAAVGDSSAPSFPSLPDEVPCAAPVQRTHARVSLPVAPSPSASAPVRRPRDIDESVGAWPTLPPERIPAQRAGPEASWRTAPHGDRWPDLPQDENDEGDDADLSLPAGHRERLEREQRGLSWNG